MAKWYANYHLFPCPKNKNPTKHKHGMKRECRYKEAIISLFSGFFIFSHLY